ncbi:MAG: hypothetical protein LC676_14740 [Loktanella sp.]|nr:hypothetical protein [Loktanella sp.]
MLSTFLVISFDELDDRSLDIKYIQAENEEDALAKSEFSKAIAILAKTSTSTQAFRKSEFGSRDAQTKPPHPPKKNALASYHARQ